MTLLSAAIAKAIPELGGKDAAKAEWKLLRERLQILADRGLSEHHRLVSSWATEVHSLPLGLGPKARQTTVEVQINSGLRRFGTEGEPLAETELLSDGSNFVILGDPGAGKTTLLRRLARQLLDEPGDLESASWRFVFILICRDYDAQGASGLYDMLARMLGLDGRLAKEVDALPQVIRAILGSNAVLLIDGIDETSPALRRTLDRELVELARTIPSLKVIATCRSGDYRRAHEGFSLIEIQPLSSEQIDHLVRSWLDVTEAERFLASVNPEIYPAHDLLDRPLFLAQMVGTFRRRERLPERPADLCRSIVRLVLQDWDEQRAVNRLSGPTSAYARLDTEDKLAFIADLAYELLQQKLRVFENHELERAYQRVAPRYEALPLKQSRLVATEIESHNGLIVQSGRAFQFSHLSLQEYLAAESMIRRPADRRISWHLNPALAAVSVALSTDASAALEDFVRQLPRKGVERTAELASFVHRLGQERPRFTPSANTGRALIRLVDALGDGGGSFARRLFSMPNSQKSLRLTESSEHFSIRQEADHAVFSDSGNTYRVPRSLLHL